MNTERHRPISLTSELIPQKLYSIENNGPYIYTGSGNNVHGALMYYFVHHKTAETYTLSKMSIDKLIGAHQIVQTQFEDDFPLTVPDYPKLDIFTSNTFMSPTNEIFRINRIMELFTRSELLKLNDLCEKFDLTDIPTPGEGEFMRLLQEPVWQLFKKYLLTISPDLNLPEDFA